MGTPIIPQKRFLAAGAIRSTESWGTATGMGALNGMLIKEDGGLKITRPYLPAKEADIPFVMEGDLGNIDPVDFAIGFSMRYDPCAIGVLIAQLFGTALPEPDPVGDGYVHHFQWKDHNYGQFVTFAIERARKIFEVPSAKVYSLDFSIADGFLEGSIGLRGNALNNYSIINSPNQIDALTYKDKKNRTKFSQIAVSMNAETGGDFGATESNLEVSDLSVHYERPHDALYGAGSPSIIEPMENGPPIITVTLNFPRMNDDNDEYFALFNAETEQKLQICATGKLLDGVYNYTFGQYFPRMRIIDIDYPFDDIVPATITLQAEEAASIPSPFQYKRPCIVMRNLRSSNYLT